jgi:hypothetical protein
MTSAPQSPAVFAQELMETVMLKHFAAATLGLAVLFGAIGPAAADKARHHWNNNGAFVYSHGLDAYSYGPRAPKYATRNGRAQPNIRLDMETEAVWRNLRPSWFD